ncbi:MAG TPA: hypothetical protein VFX98_17200 [Longimicrobiaceae bacterium]|nr:hypothetical protein [Longimicrobiaceae bacterium]
MKFLKRGDTSRAICERCQRVVPVRFDYGTFRLSEPEVDVPDVLLGYCAECGEVATVPFQSSPRLNAARKRAEAPLEARVPRHLEDVLGVVAHHYGRADTDFRATILRYYLHLLAEDAGVADRVRELARSDLARGAADGRVSLKVRRPVLERAWGNARRHGIRQKSEMVRGVIVAAAQDLEGRDRLSRRQRQALTAIAAAG